MREPAPAGVEDTESPIEAAMLAVLRDWLDHHEVAATISTQVEFGSYRLDLVVNVNGAQLAVECDGAAFHSAPRAVEHDRRRDRYCLTRGVPVMRFTGAEIYADPRGCAAQVGMWVRAQRRPC